MENSILILISFSFLSYLSAGLIKNKFFPLIARTGLILVVFANFYLMLAHLLQTQRLPLTNTSETLLSLITLIILIYLALADKLRLSPAAGLLVSLISFIGIYSSFYIFKKPLMPLLPALQSRWLVFHVLSCIIAYGFFTIAFILALVYILKKEKGWGILLIMQRSICLGFLFLTLGIILGSIWGKFAWGNWWNWDAKETWALITWLIYGRYIHSCLLEKQTEKKLSAVSILGFLACLFTYLGVNYLLRGLHSYG